MYYFKIGDVKCMCDTPAELAALVTVVSAPPTDERKQRLEDLANTPPELLGPMKAAAAVVKKTRARAANKAGIQKSWEMARLYAKRKGLSVPVARNRIATSGAVRAHAQRLYDQANG